MKNFKYSKYTPLIIIIVSICISCSKLTDNGKLDGKWHLIEMYSKTSPKDPTYSIFQPKYDTTIHWIFQLRLLNIIAKDLSDEVRLSDIMARFNCVGNILDVTETYVHFRDRDSLLTDPKTTILEPIGIRGNSTKYRIEKLNSSRMILCSEYDSLIFRK